MIILQKIDKAKKNNEFVEAYAHIIIQITRLENLIDFFICELHLQLLKAVFQFF